MYIMTGAEDLCSIIYFAYYVLLDHENGGKRNKYISHGASFENVILHIYSIL